jgi:putative transposase
VPAFIDHLTAEAIQISRDGRSRHLDNVFIERLWRSIEYELIYIKAFTKGIYLQQEVKQWFEWHQAHPDQALDTKHWNRFIV